MPLPFPWTTESRDDGFYVVSIDGRREVVCGPLPEDTAKLISAVGEFVGLAIDAARSGDTHTKRLARSALEKAGVL